MPYAHPCFKQRRGKGMAEHVRGNVACGANTVKMFMYDATNGLRHQEPVSAVNGENVLRDYFSDVLGMLFIQKHYQFWHCQIDYPLLLSHAIYQ